MAGGRDGAPRRPLLRRSGPGDFRRRLRRAEATQRRDRGAASGPDPARLPVRTCRRRRLQPVRRGAARRAHAVAGQRLRRRRGARLRGPHRAFSETTRRAHRLCGRAQDRRLVRQPLVRRWGAERRRDARRRPHGRGCHGQSEDHRRHSPPPAWRRLAVPHRNQGRGLCSERRLRALQRRGRGRGSAHLRQSPQLRRRIAAPEGCEDHGAPPVEVLRLRLGRALVGLRDHPGRGLGPTARLGFSGQRALGSRRGRRRTDRGLSGAGAGSGRARL